MQCGQVLKKEDPETGVVQLKLSNGIAINFRRSLNEPQAAMVRMVASGGRSAEGASPQDSRGLAPAEVSALQSATPIVLSALNESLEL